MKFDKKTQRTRRHWRVRAKVKGNPSRPRLTVFRSNKYISAQIINDEAGVTIASASSAQKAIQTDLGAVKFCSVEAAKLVGKVLAEKAKGAGVTAVSFDRGPYKYHGRVKALADAAREAGLEF
jgi:large subunit ribosomal protein L18